MGAWRGCVYQAAGQVPQAAKKDRDPGLVRTVANFLAIHPIRGDNRWYYTLPTRAVRCTLECVTAYDPCHF